MNESLRNSSNARRCSSKERSPDERLLYQYLILPCRGLSLPHWRIH